MLKKLFSSIIYFLPIYVVFGVFLFPQSTYASLALKSHWNLDELSGSRLDSVSGNNLTPVNTPASVAGYSGNAVSFPIASSSYLTVDDSESLSTTGSTTFKISLRVKLLSKTGTQVFVSKYDGVGQGEYAVYYEHSYRRFIFSTYSAGGIGNHYVLADTFGEPQLDTWYQIEAIHDGLANTNTITVNGTYTDIATEAGKHQDTTAPFRIGAFGAGPTYYAGAVIDDVSFYKAPVEDMPANLVGYWKFDEGSGTVAVDTAYGDHNGTISGATYSTEIPPDVEFSDPYSLNFDGVNDGVSTSLSLNNYSAFTLAGWAYPRTAATGEGWFGANDVFEFFFTSGSSVKCWTPRGEVDWSFTPETFLNNWHHITCLGTGSSVILYVDGYQVASSSHSATGNYGTGDNFSIGLGVQSGGTSGPFDGRIDDVRVYNRALTPQEMNSLGTGSEQPVNNPTINSFSPATNATGVSLTPTLSATFSTTSIATSSGDILLYKVEGGELVETISVSSAQVQKNGATISITPSVTLEESKEYYLWVLGNIFKDADDLFYVGTAATSTWRFTTGDFTAPTISSVLATSTDTTASITWSTNQSASTQVSYGLTPSYDVTTTEVDTSPRVTNHSVSFGSLISCTEYYYSVISNDAAGNQASSSNVSFITQGCGGINPPSSATSTSFAPVTSATTTLSEQGRSLIVNTPAHFTDASSTVHIQIKSLSAEDVLDEFGAPVSKRSAADIVFDVKAIMNDVVLDSFVYPVTMTYVYTDEDIVGLDESTLWMHHYHSSAWSPLNDCTVNTVTNTITCTTPSFSIFGIFGSPATIPTGSTVSSGPGAGGTYFGCRDQKATNYEYFSHHTQRLCVYASSTPILKTDNIDFARNLKIGMTGQDVFYLQKFLNTNGFTIAKSGAGSPGHETTRFGSLTKEALARFQRTKGIYPTIGYFGPLTRQYLSLNFK